MKIKTTIDFKNTKWKDGFLWGLSFMGLILILLLIILSKIF